MADPRLDYLPHALPADPAELDYLPYELTGEPAELELMEDVPGATVPEGYEGLFDPEDLPDTGGMQSSLGTLQSLSKQYLQGIDPKAAFDKIKAGKIAALRAARAAFETPPGETDLARMQFGARMIGPTRTGRFGEAVSSGLEAAIPLMQNQREIEQARRTGMAGIGAQEATLEGEDLYSRMTTGLDLLTKANDLEYKIKDLQNKGLWKLLDRRTRLDVSREAASARRDAAHIIAGQREQTALAQAVQRAQMAARQDAQTLTTMGYSLPPDQYEPWIQDRVSHIMKSWGYTPEQYQKALPVVGGSMTPEETELQKELSLEEMARQGAPAPAPISQAPTEQPPVSSAAPVSEPSAPAGGWSRQAKPLNPTELKLVEGAEEKVQGMILAEEALQKALEINDKTYTGDLAMSHAWVERNLTWLPWMEQSEKAKNTTEFNNLINQQVVSNLKATFGGSQITDSERKYLEQLQASIDKSADERRPILERGIEFIRSRRAYNDWIARSIRDGTYRNQTFTDWAKLHGTETHKKILGVQ